MSDRTVVSTFSGIGGIDLGLERAGWTVVAQAEKDAYRRAVLTERFPGVECADDVSEVRGWDLWRKGWNLQPGQRWSPALLCGGFPCQDLSVAGRRAGLAGERSGLFFAFADVAESLRPRWLLIENVPGLLSSNGGRDFGELVGTLADLGYGVAWRILDSRFFGVPQRRRRVFIVGCDVGGRAGAERAGAVLAVGAGCGGHPAAGVEEGPLPAGISGAGPDGPGRGRDEEGSLVVNALKSTGGRSGGNSYDGSGIVVSTLQAPKGRGWRTDAEAAAGGHLVTHALTSEGHDASEDGTGRGTPLTVVGPVAFAHDRDHPGEDGLTPTLRRNADGRGTGAGASVYAATGSSVRRLTPRECERLQGFPDDWTRVTWRGKPAADSLRYAACGDAVTVPVAEWLGRRLLSAEATP